MKFSIVTIFPEIFNSTTKSGITRNAFEKNLCTLELFNPRDFTSDPYKRVDDKSFGGGAGAVMKVDILESALTAAIKRQHNQGISNPYKIYLSPQGQKANQDLISILLKKPGIILVCGRYEGVDERFIQRNIDLEVSIGDFVVSGGELPAQILMDGIIRQIPGVLNSQESFINDSFMDGLLDYPHYTHPRVYNGDAVPDILLSGNHKEIEKWRLKMSLLRTLQRRPDLLEKRTLTKIESRLLEEALKEASTPKS